MNAAVFDTKIIHDKAKSDGTGEVTKKARGVLTLDVAMAVKVGNECIVGNAASLGKAVHATTDFNINMVMVNEWTKVIIIKDCFGDVANVYPHVLVVGHGSA